MVCVTLVIDRKRNIWLEEQRHQIELERTSGTEQKQRHTMSGIDDSGEEMMSVAVFLLPGSPGKEPQHLHPHGSFKLFA